MKPPTRKLSDRHEEHLAAVLEGRRTANSGATSRDQMDGKQVYRSGKYVFTWDGKATLGVGITITRKMWLKAKEQAHWAIPIIPLRWYVDNRLNEADVDLVVVELSVFAEMQRDANRWAASQ